MTSSSHPAVAVVGGSIIGLSCALALHRQGVQVRIIAPQAPEELPADGAAWVAGGMFGAYTEAWPGEEDHVELGVAALAAWERLLPQLADSATALGVELVTGTGVILAGMDASDAADIRTVTETITAHYPGVVQSLSRAELKRTEPVLSRGIRAAALCPSEHSVDNRAVLAALRHAVAAAGVPFIQARPQTAAELAALIAPEEYVVIAAGHASTQFLDIRLRPVKGEVIRLRVRPGTEEPPRYTIRGRVHGRPLYLVPRAGGLAVGATEYEHGEDTQVTVGGVQQLLDDAELLFPGITDYEFVEVSAGLRPYSPDNLPLIGPADDLARAPLGGGVYAACGHGRNGILLAALTAELIAGHLCEGAEIPAVVSPQRFTTLD